MESTLTWGQSRAGSILAYHSNWRSSPFVHSFFRIKKIQSRRSIGRMPDYESGDWGSNPCVTAKRGFKVTRFQGRSNLETLKLGNPETSNTRVAQSAGGARLRNAKVWVRIPPGVQEDVGGRFWIGIPKNLLRRCVRPTLNGEYGVTAALQSSKLKVSVRVRLLAQIRKIKQSHRSGGRFRKPGLGAT